MGSGSCRCCWQVAGWCIAGGFFGQAGGRIRRFARCGAFRGLSCARRCGRRRRRRCRGRCVCVAHVSGWRLSETVFGRVAGRGRFRIGDWETKALVATRVGMDRAEDREVPRGGGWRVSRVSCWYVWGPENAVGFRVWMSGIDRVCGGQGAAGDWGGGKREG